MKAANNTVIIKVSELNIGPLVKGKLIEGIQKSKPEVGEVVDVGQPKKDDELPYAGIKKGDLIAYRQFGEKRFMLGTEEYMFVVFNDVLGQIINVDKKE